MSKKLIYSDFDNVMNNWCVRFCEWVKREYNIDLSDTNDYQFGEKISINHIDEFNDYLYERFLYDEENVLQFYLTDDIQSKLEKYEIVLITSRTKTIDNYAFISDYLIGNQLHWSVIFSERMKADYLPNKDVVFIDDNPKELEYALSKGFKHVLKYNTKYNTESKGIPVNDWNDIIKYMEDNV